MRAIDLTPDLVGALVKYNGGFTPEYGLVQSVDPVVGIAFVRFHLGDTAAGCYPRDLDLVVPAVRPQDQRRIERAIEVLEQPIDLTKVQDTPAGRALWKAAQSDLALEILRGDAE